MKTFETEKHNIPEGATHYFNEDHFNYFTWVAVDSFGNCWGLIEKSEVTGGIKPIPQTNTETPEEKEALDSIDSNLIKPREMTQPRFSKCETVFSFSHGERRFTLRGIDTDHPQLEVVRHETEAERVEREREEFEVEICKDLGIDAVGCNTACIINKLYELGYRKESE